MLVLIENKSQTAEGFFSFNFSEPCSGSGSAFEVKVSAKLWVQTEISLNALLIVLEARLRTIKNFQIYADDDDNLDDNGCNCSTLSHCIVSSFWYFHPAILSIVIRCIFKIDSSLLIFIDNIV